jgi:cellobiose phosphorylase
MRRSLGSVDHEEPAPDLVLFHSSTLVPSRFVTEKSEFVGEAGTLRSPRFLSDDQQVGGDGPAEEAVASMTVEIDLPIEGEAEFGFCFGAAASAEEAFEVARGLSNVRAVNTAIDGSLARWQELCATVQVRTQDRGFDALVNAWLPYEAYAGWVGNRTAGVCLDPAWAADALRSLYALSATAPELCRDSLLSFASGISVVGAYSPDSESHIALPPEEMLWLAAAAAKYVVETGDTSVLAEKIVTREGISLTLKEHCERVIGLCVNGGAANRLVDDTVKAWLLACGDAAGRDRLDEGMAWRRNVERKEHPEVRSLPRRVNHLMSVSSALSDQPISNAIHNRFDSDDAVSESGEACRLHSALVDDVLGIRATGDGLVLRPDIPRSWCEVDIVRRYRGDTYSIRIRRPVAPTKEGMSIVVDGEPVMGDTLPYFGDGAEHEVEVILS